MHMAVGYSQFPLVQLLLEAGADPSIPDRNGRDVVSLIEHIRASMPVPTPELMGRMMALEQVANFLNGERRHCPGPHRAACVLSLLSNPLTKRSLVDLAGWSLRSRLCVIVTSAW